MPTIGTMLPRDRGTCPYDPDSAHPYDVEMTQANPPSRTGKRVAIALAVVWVVIVVGLYAVLAKLKMGGAEALRKDAAAAPASASK